MTRKNLLAAVAAGAAAAGVASRAIRGRRTIEFAGGNGVSPGGPSGIGMVLVVPEREAEDVMIRLSGLNETAYHIGEVVKCEAGKECVELV